MRRHPQNHNLHIHHDHTYQGLPVMHEKGPFIREHLQRLYDTMQRALDEHPRTFAFRVELKFPSSGMLPSYAFRNEVISRFFESFKAKIEHSRGMAKRRNRYAHPCTVRYIWVREIASSDRPHYHLVIFLNKDAYSVLGYFQSEGRNVFNRLEEAWASALRLPREAVAGLVHVPQNPGYYISRDDEQSQAEFFRRASYLCKTATKMYGDRQHSFGASRG